MTIDFMEYIKAAFEDVDGLNLDQVRKLVLEANSYFESLESVLKYGDPKAKEGVLAAALDVKEFLDAKVGQTSPPPILEALSEEEREMVAEMTLGLKLAGSGKSENKSKKLKPIKLRSI